MAIGIPPPQIMSDDRIAVGIVAQAEGAALIVGQFGRQAAQHHIAGATSAPPGRGQDLAPGEVIPQARLVPVIGQHDILPADPGGTEAGRLRRGRAQQNGNQQKKNKGHGTIRRCLPPS